jgi:hypothetical protein
MWTDGPRGHDIPNRRFSELCERVGKLTAFPGLRRDRQKELVAIRETEIETNPS